MSRWFRAYDDALNDPKVQGLEPDLFKAWFNVLCIASKYNGTLPETFHVAFHLRCSETDARFICVSLREKGLLDETAKGTLTPHNWNGRQYKSDTSTERVKRFRKRKRNVSETPPDTDTDTDNTKPVSNGKDHHSFDQFWHAYPKKVAKIAAEKAYAKAVKLATPEQILAAVVAQAGKWTDPKYIPNPSTWLNAGRWQDELITAEGSYDWRRHLV